MKDNGWEFIESISSFCNNKREWIIVREEETDYSYGKIPSERSLEERFDLGIINLDKPPGPTSHEVVAWIKRMFGLKKAGHGGTLEEIV
ncbi:MAG: tRNA pseudouridine synthase A [Desulfurococcales archaeon]|nr:tRNA pseudouridine synthase A [Desulfurococcales archaeon]